LAVVAKNPRTGLWRLEPDHGNYIVSSRTKYPFSRTCGKIAAKLRKQPGAATLIQAVDAASVGGLASERRFNMRVKPALIEPRVLMAAFVAAGGLILMAGEASAATHTRLAHAREYRFHESSSPKDLFESYANGHQSYENPDRELYVWGD
jgi:hypothetical protein